MYHFPSLTAFVILTCSLLTCFSAFFQSILSHWSRSCTLVSFSPFGVIEFPTFIDLPSITQQNTDDKSAPFQAKANFEPLFSRLQTDFRFLSYPIPSASLSLFAEFLPVFGDA